MISVTAVFATTKTTERQSNRVATATNAERSHTKHHPRQGERETGTPPPATPLAHGHMWEQHVLGTGRSGGCQNPPVATGGTARRRVRQAPQQQMQSANPELMAAHGQRGPAKIATVLARIRFSR